MEIPNRFVMGPAGFGFCNETKGMINDCTIESFRRRARGAIGGEGLKEGVMIQQEDGAETELPADTVVRAIGSCSVNGLYEQIKDKVDNFALIGDAAKFAFALAAVHAVYDVAYKI